MPRPPNNDSYISGGYKCINHKDAIEFLKSIWGINASAECFSIVTLNGSMSFRLFCFSEYPTWESLFKAVEEYVSGLDCDKNVYYQVLPLAERPEKGRGSAKDVSTAMWLFVDLDYKKAVDGAKFEGCVEKADHALECYYVEGGKAIHVSRPPLNTVIRDIQAKTGLTPTLVVDSGAGYHLYFKLSYEVDVETWRRFEDWLVSRVGGDPQAKDPARILRLPGTLNPRVNRPCKVIDSYPSEIDPTGLEEKLKPKPLTSVILEKLGLKREEKPSPMPSLEFRRLSDSAVSKIVKALSEAYRPGYRQRIVLHLSGLLAKEKVSPLSAIEIAMALYKLTQDSDPLKVRLGAIVYSYKKVGVDVDAFASEIEAMTGVKPYGLEHEIGESEVKGYTGLIEDLSEVIGEEKAREALKVIEEALGERTIEHEIKEITEKVKPNRLDRIAAPIVRYILQAKIIKTFYRPHGNEVIGIYCFDGKRYYSCEAELEKEIYEKVKLTNPDIEDIYGNRVVKEIMARIRTRTLTELSYEPLAIVFSDGKILYWDCLLGGGDIYSCVSNPSPDIIVFHLIPHKLLLEDLREYMKAKGINDVNDVDPLKYLEEKAPSIARAFKDWVGDKAILLLEAVGYVLYPKYDLHKAFMLIGEGANGKSTYLRLLKDTVGNENTVSISLQELTGDRGHFMRARLYRKLLNAYPDLPSRALRETGEFKVLTGEDTITADRKHRDPVTFENYAKLFFSANLLPEVYDPTTAFWRRWIVIEFPNRFPVNPGFYDTLRGEIEHLIMAGILAFVKVWRRRSFSFEGTEADYKHKWLYNASSVYAFLYDAEKLKVIRRDSNAKCLASDLYQLYVAYCQNSDREIKDKRSFTVELESLGISKVVYKGTSYYKGIEIIRKDWPEEP